MATSEKDCIFCKIIAGQLPSSQIYADEGCLVFFDIHPINPGHILVIPKRHSERFYDLTDSEAAHLMGVARKIYAAVRKTSIRTEGANLFLSDGAVAGQEVGHAHLHIVPRYQGDGQAVGFKRPNPAAGKLEFLEKIAIEVKKHLI